MRTELLIKIVEKSDKDFALALVPADTLEKFAELIVRECLNKVNEAVCEREMSNRYYPDSDGRKILKHFGVEE